MQTILQNILKQVIQENYGIILDDIKLDVPPKKELGDFAFGAFILSKELKKSPNQIAEELTNKLKSNVGADFMSALEEVNNEGPYLNFKMNKNIWTEKFKEIYKEIVVSANHHLPENQKQTIIIDYIGPNVGKPLHIGHLCTPNQGQVMINIYKKLGYNVISDSHIGDWGIIFGKLILAYKMWGDREELKNDAVAHLYDLYVRISLDENKYLEEETREEFKKLAEGNPESIELWKEFTGYSIENVRKVLARLGVKPDLDIGESFYEGLNLPKLQDYPDLKYTMKDIVEELIEKKIATKNEDGSVGVVFENLTQFSPNKEKGGYILPSCILQKNNGTHGYLASDLACVKYRMENWKPSKIIYFVDVRQQLHFQQVFEISRMAGWIEKTELFHAYNGFISLKDGAMSSRKGNIIPLVPLLDEAENRAKVILEQRDDVSKDELNELAKIIGIGAIKYGYLKKNRETDVIFDWDEFMNFEGNSGPYIQYSYVRAIKILQKTNVGAKDFLPEISFETDEEINLIKLFSDYKDILLETAQKCMPHILCKYTYDLAKAFGTFYNNVPVLAEKNENKQILRFKLIDLYINILQDAFGCLGINMPEKM